MAHVLQDYPQEVVAKSDYLKQLQIYSKSHRLKLADGSEVCWIDENLDPNTGEWLARSRLIDLAKTSKDPGKQIIERGQHYNHSTFCDLVISGLVGLRPRPDKVLVIQPLVPEDGWDWFRLENVKYHGHRLTIQWDRDGRKYGKGKGLQVFADGKRIGGLDNLGLLQAELP